MISSFLIEYYLIQKQNNHRTHFENISQIHEYNSIKAGKTEGFSLFFEKNEAENLNNIIHVHHFSSVNDYFQSKKNQERPVK